MTASEDIAAVRERAKRIQAELYAHLNASDGDINDHDLLVRDLTDDVLMLAGRLADAERERDELREERLVRFVWQAEDGPLLRNTNDSTEEYLTRSELQARVAAHEEALTEIKFRVFPEHAGPDYWESQSNELREIAARALLASSPGTTRPDPNADCIECNEGNKPEWAADKVTPCHRIGTAAIKCPVSASPGTTAKEGAA